MRPPEPSTAFPRLFEPLPVGSLTLRNRIVSSGHDTVMAIDGFVSEQLIAYQAARAAGGAGEPRQARILPETPDDPTGSRMRG